MIARYRDKVLSTVWSDPSKYQAWLSAGFAFAVANGMAEEDARNRHRALVAQLGALIREAERLELETGHDVASFVQAVQDAMPMPEFHAPGTTSSDLVDNWLAWALTQSVRHLDGLNVALLSVLDKVAARDWEVVTVSRTHGRVAKRMPMGRRWVQHGSEVRRAWERVSRNLPLPFKIGGIDGTLDQPDRKVVGLTLARWMDWRGPVVACTQVVPRDVMAALAGDLQLYGQVLMRMALTVRLLSQSGIDEVQEPLTKAHVGSSAMPHKVNPVACEKVCGLQRLVDGYASALTACTGLWLERDVSNSSVERVAWPDMLHLLSHMTVTMTRVMEGLTVKADNVATTAASCVESHVMLAAEMEGGATRSDAYRRVQELLWNDRLT